MNRFLFPVFILAAMVMACQSNSNNEPEASATDTMQTNQQEPDTSRGQGQPTATQATEDNTVRLIRLTLSDLYKDDIAKELIDTFSRQFKYSPYDLNNDGKQEILVGLTGPYFCGSGGCTMYLLTNHGDVITKFSVVSYPVYVDTITTKGWKDLIIYSGGSNRVVKWNGKSYPSNPSILPKMTAEPSAKQTKLLDWEEQQSFNF
jgi:hypothetical protein